MENFITLDILIRWSHVLFGITWIGLLYYFNFIQGEYFKEAEASAKADATKKLAPRALWWFRWGAMFTFITGVLLLVSIRQTYGFNGYIIMGALMGTLMFLNVWLIIWPNQKIVTGLVEGDASVAGPKALLASRTNTLFSAPMALGMIASSHGNVGAAGKSVYQAVIGFEGIGTGLAIVIAIIILLEINAIVGKMGPMASVKGVIHCSIALTAVCLALLQFV
ncbi:hypothetical protein GP2143_10412 [marine gamma proteobacterium HTCC2143]|jgi:uncharacterized membrane protein|uniref:Urate oxidase N-terminal domain-containing protein n=1 Tax=marine gamma proteobacterium HTCC2143 TaxID=247633 RepID=A0YDW9_9GAMM|nr:hypothetical protein GP2143_10412 [marine gamma proteobacterium HTCC2143]|tara:strand:+ start:472 stop:1137 length:666 start_codon:yes stop_codon:yes gene_type:complete